MASIGQNVKSVTIHRVPGSPRCPLAVTRIPFATPSTATDGATHRRRPSIRNRRRIGSQALIGPVMRNRRGFEHTMEVNDRGMGDTSPSAGVARTAPGRTPRRHIARRGQPPRACPEVLSLSPSQRPVECLSGARGLRLRRNRYQSARFVVREPRAPVRGVGTHRARRPFP